MSGKSYKISKTVILLYLLTAFISSSSCDYVENLNNKKINDTGKWQRPSFTRDDLMNTNVEQQYDKQKIQDTIFNSSSEGHFYLDDLPRRAATRRIKLALSQDTVLPLRQQIDKRSNIILIITDDLDIELGSLNYMPRLLHLLKGHGAIFSNAYTTTPMCCPSRSSMLTGMYIHNHEVFTNHQNCSNSKWQNTHERKTFASYLRSAGYRTGYFGKYLNRYNGSHIPSGWHDWSALLMNSRYYNYTVNRNNKMIKYGNRYPQDYYPHIITRDGLNFLKERQTRYANDPFLLVLSYPSPHGPEDSAPEHAHKFFNASDHHTASYNYAPNPDKQWVLQFTDRMPDLQLKFTDLLMTKRLQTLQSVDEAIERIAKAVDRMRLTDNTYVFFTSDHGYHLGQYGLTKGKAMPFEFDVKVPFIVKGPQIKAGVELSHIALNVDLAPTFLDIAGVAIPPQMDGRSLLPVLQSSMFPDKLSNVPWRDTFLVESSGRVREEEVLEKKEQRSWERDRALTRTLEALSVNSVTVGNVNEGKTVSLYTSKHERLEEVCKRGEFGFPCNTSQKWYCTNIGGRWKIRKCRNKSSMWQKHCVCRYHEGYGTFGKLEARERQKQRNFLKKYVTKGLHSRGSKFLKSFTNVEILLNPVLSIPRHRHRGRKRRKPTRFERSLDDDDEWTLDSEESSGNPVDKIQRLDIKGSGAEPHITTETNSSETVLDNSSSDPLETTKVSANNFTEAKYDDSVVDLSLPDTITDLSVHAFVEEEELRDLEDQIINITDELESLENVRSTAVPNEATNISLITESSSDVDCQANKSHTDCQDEVSHNFMSWKDSTLSLEGQIARLKQQLAIMKNILLHLQSEKPEDHSIMDYNTEDKVEEPDYNIDEDTYDNTDGHLGHDYEYHGNVDDVTDKSIKTDLFYPSHENKYKGSFESDRPTVTLDNSVIHASDSKYIEKGSEIKTNNTSLSGNNLPEIGLEFPVAEDVTFSTRLEANRRMQAKNFANRMKNFADYGLHTDISEGESGIGDHYILRSRLYPVQLPEVENQATLSGIEGSHRICWCNKRILKKIEIAEARKRKRKERLEIKQKRQKRKHREKKQRKREKAMSCNYPKLNCYTHTNEHWKTPPLWTDGNFCFCINSANNTYWCLRTINSTHNFLYCEFITGLITYYDLHIDPYQLRNVAFTLSTEKVLELHEKLTRLRSCKGADDCDGYTSVTPLKTDTNNNYVSGEMKSPFAVMEISRSRFGRRPVNSKAKKRKKKREGRRLRKEKKLREKFDLTQLDEDPFSLNLSHKIRLPRKSKLRKEKRRQRKQKIDQRRKQKRNMQ